MDITEIKQLGALRPDLAKRALTNVHMTAAELRRFKVLAKVCGVNFSGLTRAALRALETQIQQELAQPKGAD